MNKEIIKIIKGNSKDEKKNIGKGIINLLIMDKRLTI